MKFSICVQQPHPFHLKWSCQILVPFSKRTIAFVKNIIDPLIFLKLSPRFLKILFQICQLIAPVIYYVHCCLLLMLIKRNTATSTSFCIWWNAGVTFLDKGSTVGTVVMNLSKAFDKMPHALLIAKLHTYGLSEDACDPIINYLRNWRHRVKITGTCSEWATINHGVPQGSELGPLLLNIILNGLLCVNMGSEVANYVDDNHLNYEGKCIKVYENHLRKLQDFCYHLVWQ